MSVVIKVVKSRFSTLSPFCVITKILLFSSLFPPACCDSPPHCRSTDSSPYKNLSTKTPYSYVVREKNPGPVTVASCEPAQFWTIVRHGTRHPSKKAIRLMKYSLPLLQDMIVGAAEKGRSGLCSQDLEALKEWSSGTSEEEEKNLHPEGDNEMILLGERWLMRLPRLLGPDYHQEMFTFRATNTERAVRSGVGFATGLFTRPVANRVKFSDPIDPHDPLLRFYKLCDNWKKNVKKNPLALKEKILFERSDLMIETLKNVSLFLGLNSSSRDEIKKNNDSLNATDKADAAVVDDNALTLDDLDSMYVACNFDQSWHPDKLSPFCSVFNTDQLKIMEYREDLEYYWIDGPGFPVTYEQACVLMSDIFHNFLNVTKESAEEENGILYFSHSGAVLKLLAFLDVYRDTDSLRSDNYDRMSDRRWKTSHMGVFGSNVAFVLQKCDNPVDPTGRKNYKVGLFVNEEMETIPGCDELWCDWGIFTELFRDRVAQCDFDKICSVGDENVVVPDVPDDRF